MENNGMSKFSKFLSFLALASLLLAACGGAAATTAVAPTQAPTAVPEKPLLVGFIFPGVVNDGSFNSLGFNAMNAAAKVAGFQTTHAESVAPTDAPRVMGEMINNNKATIIWTHSGTFVDPVMKTAPTYPETSFVVYTGSKVPDAAPNIWQIANVTGFQQVYCAAGVLAANMSKSNVIGFVGGIELPVYAKGLASYELCAKSVKPDIQVLGSFTGDFDDAVKAKEAATAQMEQGADVFAHAVNLGVYGLLEAAKAKPDVFIVGAAKDELALDAERIISAVYIDYEKLMEEIIPKANQGELGGFYESTLDKGTAVVAPVSDKVSAEVKQALETAIEQIKSGSLKFVP